METATAMEDSVLKQMTCADFLARLTDDGLGEGFIKYLATRLACQQHLITSLTTMDSEHRLAATLLQLARKLGTRGAVNWRLKQKVSHQELAEMVGTTRPRISEFMRRFRDLGLIETTEECFLIVKEQHLAEYLDASTHLAATATRKIVLQKCPILDRQRSGDSLVFAYRYSQKFYENSWGDGTR